MAKNPFRMQLDWSLLRRVLRIAAPFRSLLWISAVLTILQGLMVGLQPYLIQQTLDVQVANRDVPGIARMSLILLALVLFQALITFLSGYFSARAGQEVVRTLRNYVFEHLVALRMKFYDKTPVGTLVTRTISDIETIADLFSAGLITIAGDIFQLLVILSFMLWMNWKLTLISLSVLPLLLYAAQKFRIGVRDSFQEVRAQVARLNAFVQERITGMQVVQLFHREYAEYGRFERINREHREAHVKGVFYYSVFFPVVELIVALTFALLVWYGAKGMLEGTVAFGEITAFILFINLFFRPVRAVADRFNNIQMGLVAVERIFKLMDETENREQDGTLDASGIKGEIAFDHVHFAYEPSTPVLHDLSFYLEPGKTLAIVGPTGAGKTSIIGLLSRFYEYQEGRILLDGMPIESYKLDSLRSRIAVVLQDVFLFSGSVFDNMRMKDLAISEEKVAEVARAIGAYDFIEQLPGGFSFNVMERGSSLSVGQRQLISFIRALSTDPAVIILDEATSSVDSETEALIQKAITTMLQGRTGIVIAHRLSTIKHADYIMVLDHGRCVQWGTHEQLLQQEGMYQTLYRSQFGKIAEEA